MVALAGVTAIETSAAGFTVSTAVLLVMLPEVAVMLEDPRPRPLATPLPLIEAAVPLLELQATDLVRFCVLLSVYVPVAVNAWVWPLAMVALAGVTAIET